jgi:hypothetical protein|tara:strand:- start:121 stop:285 length:165 start_codon:yes stop_codon:yes gene_type:complete
MDNREFQLYEQRIDNCWHAADSFEEGTWGKDFWSQNAMYLLRKMNDELNGGTEK